MTNDEFILKCEELVVEHYKKQGVDLSTKEKRMALTADKKAEIYNALMSTYMKLMLGQ